MSESSYITIARRGESVYEEKKSVFYGFAAPVTREEEALALIAEAKAKYPDARHHVYAYLLRDRSIMRYSDDHEPQGTAGMPTLDAIRKSGIVDAALVVVRYFGGTLLGTGGLVRAYGRAASDALTDAGIVTMREFRTVYLELTYNDHPRVQPILARLGVPIVDSAFGAGVTLTCRLHEEDVPTLTRAIVEATAARAVLREGEICFDYDRI